MTIESEKPSPSKAAGDATLSCTCIMCFLYLGSLALNCMQLQMAQAPLGDKEQAKQPFHLATRYHSDEAPEK